MWLGMPGRLAAWRGWAEMVMDGGDGGDGGRGMAGMGSIDQLVLMGN